MQFNASTFQSSVELDINSNTVTALSSSCLEIWKANTKQLACINSSSEQETQRGAQPCLFAATIGGGSSGLAV
jgi:hypothetical protein